MKYENAQQATSLIKQIQKEEKELEQLSAFEDGKLKVVIVKDTTTLATVGVGKSFEHPYSNQAQVFIEDCIQIVRDRLTLLKTELEAL